MSIIHAYSQTVADGTATSVVRPSDWNSVHNQVLNMGGNTAGTSQISGADIVWAGGNNITLSANGSTVSVVGPNTVAQTVQTQASGSIAGAGFTTTTAAGAVVAATHNSAGLLMAVPAYLTTAAQSNHSHNFATTTTGGSNIVVGTANSAGATIGVPAFITTYAAQTNQTVASGNIAGVGTTLALTNATATLGVNSAGVALSLSVAGGGVINQTGPNIAVAGSTVTSGDVYFSNSPTVTFGMAGSTITASAAGGGGGGANTLSFWEVNERGNNTVHSSMGQNTIYMFPIMPPAHVAVSHIEMQMSFSTVSSSNSQQVANTIQYGLYSYGTGASSDSLMMVSSSSMLFQASFNSNTAAGWTMSQGAGSVTSSSAGTQILSYLTGQKYLYLPFTTTFAPGIEQFIAFKWSSASTGNTGPLRMSVLVMTQMSNLSFGKIGSFGASLSNASFREEFDGFARTATSSNLGNFHKTEISNLVSLHRPYMVLENE